MYESISRCLFHTVTFVHGYEQDKCDETLFSDETLISICCPPTALTAV